MSFDPLSLGGLSALFQQAAIGISLGFSFQLVTAAITLGGQAISNSIGLSMANMIDPNMGNVPVIAQFLLICSPLIFLGFGGHAIVLRALMESFVTLPIGSPLEVQSLIMLLIQLFLIYC